MKELPKQYSGKEIESTWKQFWEENNTYDPDKSKPYTFSVDTPPPTVSGNMHMGHAFSYAQGDFIVRYKRLKGENVFYPFGTDDNGLPTEHLIEKIKKVSSRKMTRQEFVKLCHETIKEIKPTFVQPWKDLAISCDYKNSYSTIDNNSTRISQQSFIDLHEKGLVYKKETPTTWCTKCQTAIAQADFENIEKQSLFNDIVFKDEEGKELVIATTRPEMLAACVALFAHPDDERYTHLKGKTVTVPLFDYEVPVLYDETVALDKGTGLMMVCTFGDKEDVEKWHKYELPLRTIFTPYGKLNELGGTYQGLNIKDARTKILEDLKEKGYLKGQKTITHFTNTHDRCGTEIEFMKTSQWFINVMDKKEKLLKAGEEITWHPQHMKVRYDNWIEGLGWDWCISRQRHFGVPFPVWYEKDTGKIIVAKQEDLPIDPIEQKPSWYPNPENLEPEKDVMDTWATSSVSPHLALNWKGEKDEFEGNFPMTIRLQSHDIIRTWAFYTIVKGLYNNNSIPWKNIMISGFVLDSKGKKMSKSKGNTIDPVQLIEKYGADVVRYGASSVKLGEDLPFHEKYLETGKKLVTKLFNASKFVHLHLEDYQGTFDITKTQAIDKWLLTKLQITIKDATSHLEKYEFAKARAAIEQFFWQDLCDNYLELVKDRLYNPQRQGKEAREAAQMTLNYVLKTTLQLFAPYLPYITEEIYSWHFAQQNESIHTTSWPKAQDWSFDQETQAGELLVEIVAQVRKIKSVENKSLRVPVTKLSITCSKEQEELLKIVLEDLQAVTKTEKTEFTEGELAVNAELGEAPPKKD